MPQRQWLKSGGPRRGLQQLLAQEPPRHRGAVISQRLTQFAEDLGDPDDLVEIWEAQETDFMTNLVIGDVSAVARAMSDLTRGMKRVTEVGSIPPQADDESPEPPASTPDSFQPSGVPILPMLPSLTPRDTIANSKLKINRSTLRATVRPESKSGMSIRMPRVVGPKPVPLTDKSDPEVRPPSKKSSRRVSDLGWYVSVIRKKKLHDKNLNLEVRKETGSLWTPDLAIASILTPASLKSTVNLPTQTSPTPAKRTYLITDLVSHPRVELSPKTTVRFEPNTAEGVLLDYRPAYPVVCKTPKDRPSDPAWPTSSRHRRAARTPVMKRENFSHRFHFTPGKEVIEKFEPSAGVRVVMDPYGRKEAPAPPETRFKMTKSTFDRRYPNQSQRLEADGLDPGRGVVEGRGRQQDLELSHKLEGAPRNSRLSGR